MALSQGGRPLEAHLPALTPDSALTTITYWMICHKGQIGLPSQRWDAHPLRAGRQDCHGGVMNGSHAHSDRVAHLSVEQLGAPPGVRIVCRGIPLGILILGRGDDETGLGQVFNWPRMGIVVGSGRTTSFSSLREYATTTLPTATPFWNRCDPSAGICGRHGRGRIASCASTWDWRHRPV